jgi:hypothetical protein
LDTIPDNPSIAENQKIIFSQDGDFPNELAGEKILGGSVATN